MVKKKAMPAAALLLSFLASCVDVSGFDTVTEVSDLRVLAVRLDPPEVELPLHDGAPDVPVRITALLAGASDEPVSWRITACPSAGSRGCEGWSPEPGTLEEALGLTELGEVDPPPTGDAPELVLNTEREMSSALMAALFESAALQGLAGSRPAFEIEAEAGGVRERAFKRLQLSLPDIAYRLLLAEAGIPICDEQGLPEGCLPYRTRLPNTNPEIETVGYRRASEEGEDGEAEPLPEDGPLIVAPGEEITLVPLAAAGSAESYQTLLIDYEDYTVRVEDMTEMLIWSWFTTAGDFGRHRTEEERTRGESNVWAAPDEAPAPDGDVWIWLVLRDNRGGVDFTNLHVRVEGDLER